MAEQGGVGLGTLFHGNVQLPIAVQGMFIVVANINAIKVALAAAVHRS